MSVRTVVGFYRAHWLSLMLMGGIMALYFSSALVHEDYWHVLAGGLAFALVLGWLWSRYDPPT